MLLYSLLHLCGVREVSPEGQALDRPAVGLEDIRAFRQLGSACPGHPEFGRTAGVETTTGPLGQGVAVSVGMAVAGRWLAERYNRPGLELFNYDVYAVLGDGCMMEGITQEAASLAGHLRLSNLCWVYDSNHISIEGPTDLALSEDVAARFLSLGWRVTRVADANDLPALDSAFQTHREGKGRPHLIIVNSHIAFGAPHKQDTREAHGEPLGPEEVRLAKRSYGWPEDASFLVPEGVREHFQDGVGRRGRALRDAWHEMFQEYRRKHPGPADQLETMWRRGLPDGWDEEIPAFAPDEKGTATRNASGEVLNAVAGRIPWILGGAADLSPSTKTRLSADGGADLSPDLPGGRNIHFGIREHAMGAMVNGMAHCGLRPFGATFLVFSDYMRMPIRLSALMELPSIFVFTHDSISLGEDGPTHQPIEQLAGLRAIPNLLVLRPADANEVAEAWRLVLQRRDGPSALVLTRQSLPTLDRARLGPASGVRRGAYVLADPAEGEPEVLLLSSGSEVALCLAARELLAAEGIGARVVSMPSWELFDQQPPEYRESVLPRAVKARVSVEQAATLGWSRYAGAEGRCLGMESFGASAPQGEVRKHFGFTPERIAAAAREQVYYWKADRDRKE